MSHATSPRTFTVERNSVHRLPWMLRCYGASVAYICKGVPNSFASEDRAQRAGAVWVEAGIPASHQGDAR